ncbi:8490_t:CDS:2, partial [Gigaspora margarita]
MCLEPIPHYETNLFNLFWDSVGCDDIDGGEMKRVENVDIAEMVEAMGVVSNIIDKGNNIAFDVP